MFVDALLAPSLPSLHTTNPSAWRTLIWVAEDLIIKRKHLCNLDAVTGISGLILATGQVLILGAHCLIDLKCAA